MTNSTTIKTIHVVVLMSSSVLSPAEQFRGRAEGTGTVLDVDGGKAAR
jgi:hypothetical protein